MLFWLRLQKLTALGINEIEIEIEKLAELITKFKKIISSKKELLKVIGKELKDIKEKYSQPRRTKIIDAVLNYDIEETIQKESVIITVTLQGYIKRGSLNNVKQQKRGGKGKTIKPIGTSSTNIICQYSYIGSFLNGRFGVQNKSLKIPVGSWPQRKISI